MIKKMVLFGVGFLITLVFFELFLQLSEIQTPMETRIDPEIGPSYIYGKRVTRFNEGFYIGGINDQGYFGPSYPKKASSDEKRVLLLGDSYVMGITLFERFHFARLLENNLNEAFEDSVQILNFGRADFNFWNMYQYYKDFAGDWEHDLVLFFVGSPDLVPIGQMEKDLYPFVYMDGDHLAINYDFRNSKKFQTYQRMEPIVAHSSIFRLAFNTKKMIVRGELLTQMLDKFAPFFDKKSKAPKKEGRKAPKAKTLPVVSKMILDELAKDPRVVLVVKKDISPSLMKELEGYSIPIVNLVSALTELEESGVDPYYWQVTGKSGHWNYAAHRKISDFLGPEIQDFLEIQ